MLNKKYLNTLILPLRWTDMDAYGHVGNARYYDFMTDARVDAFGQKDFVTNLDLQFVVVESHCAYKVPCTYPGNLLIKQYCEYVKNSSCKLVYEFFMENKPDVLCAEGWAAMVFYNAKTKAASRIPEAMRKSLS
jgi:acyl-CoA thioester hydrolase